jgi:hypothetical protein
MDDDERLRAASLEEERLRAASMEIDRLLDDIRALVTGPAWQRIERVLAHVVQLHGAGLARALQHARSAGADARFDGLVASDELLASLLVLHGLHPLPVEQRVQNALHTVRRELGIDDADLELVAIQHGSLELRAADGLGGGAMASRVAEGAIRRVIESVAPEITEVAIRTPGVLRDPTLVQLRTRREVP